MSVLNYLASSLNRRDEVPNKDLAKKIAAKNDKKAVKELIENLKNKKKDIQFDCIKVLYEIGEVKPGLISEYIKDFVELLDSKHNRMIWGTMHALDAVTNENPKAIYSSLTKIVKAADEGTVITRDHVVVILIKLYSIKHYSSNVFQLYIEQLKKAPPNQFPTYAEKAMPVINKKDKVLFLKTLSARLDEIDTDTKRKRVEKVIKKVSG